MLIGVPKEIKDGEDRVALTPAGARELVDAGHRVHVERGAGLGSGFGDADYTSAGAQLASQGDVWQADLVVKVKEPLEPEHAFLRGQILFAYLHLAGAPPALTEALLDSRTTGIAYETVTDADGRFPLLAPMSAVAGSMAPIVGSYHLARYNGGRGTLLGLILGRRHGHVTIVGDGIVGLHAASVAAGMGAEVFVFGLSEGREAELRAAISPDLHYVISTPESLASHLPETDLLIGAVLVGGARAPRLISEGMVETMPDGAVIVDVSIDQGGCVATSRPTSHSHPTFVAHGVVHYCVANMPGAYPRTSTLALAEATLPYVRRIADAGIDALRADRTLGRGVNTFAGYLTCEPVADAFGRRDRYRALGELLD
jgi:alanine dehydrogenase